MKPVTVNSLGRGTLTITVKMGASLKARIRLALVFMRIAGWLLGHRVEVQVQDLSTIPGYESEGGEF